MKDGQVFNPYKMFNGIFIPDGILEYPHLTPRAKLLYGHLTRYAGKDGKAFPSQQTLTEKLLCSERQIQRHVKELVDEKIILTIAPSPLARNQHTNNIYKFLWKEEIYQTTTLTGLEGPDDEIVGSRPDKRVVPNKIIIKDKESHEKSNLKITLRASAGSPDGSSKNSLQRDKGKKIYEVPPVRQKLLDLWYSFVSTSKPAPNTKSIEKDSKTIGRLISGKMFETLPGFTDYNKKYKYSEIEEIIKLHKLAYNPEYESSDKKYYDMYFHDFVFNKYSSTKSYFCKWLANPPKHGGFIQKNPYPIITQELINLVNNGNGNGNPSPVEMNKFIKGSKIVVEYLKSTGKKLNPVYSSDKAKARILYNAAYSDDSITGSVKAGHLCSDIMFNQRLPHYCEEKAAIFEEDHTISFFEKTI